MSLSDVVSYIVAKSPPFSEGLFLFNQFCPDANLSRLFLRSGDTIQNRQILIDALKKYCRGNNINYNPATIIKKIEVEQKKEQGNDIEKEEEPSRNKKYDSEIFNSPELQEIIARQAYIYNQKEIQRKKLNMIPYDNNPQNVAKRKDIISIILAHKSEMASISIKMKYYKVNGYLPDSPGKEDWIKERNTIRTNISRSKKAVLNAKSVDEKIVAEKRLKKWESRLKKVEENIEKNNG